MKQSRWLVTGAQGFLGSNAGTFLSEKGVTTVGLARSGRSPYFTSMEFADLTSPGEARRCIRSTSPEVILHCAALSSHQECEANPVLAQQVNVDATREVAEAAQECGARLIYLSTDAVFSGKSGNYSETDATHPFSVYGQTKLDGEKSAREINNALVIRTNFFGWSPSHQRSILEFFYHNLKDKHSVPGFTNVTTTSLYVQTLLEYIWRLSAANQTGVFHVASEDALTKYVFGQLTAQVFELDGALIAESTSQEARNISLATGKLTQALGHTPESQLSGLLRAKQDLMNNQTP